MDTTNQEQNLQASQSRPSQAAPVAATGCCGGAAPAGSDACCVLDATAKSEGRSGCGCASTARDVAPRKGCC